MIVSLTAPGKLVKKFLAETDRPMVFTVSLFYEEAKPVIHRDIKPANIIRRRIDGALILVDFGAAKQATQTMLAKTGTIHISTSVAVVSE